MRPWIEQRHPWNRSAALCVPLVGPLSWSQMVGVDSNIDGSIDALTGLRECMNILPMCCLQMPRQSSLLSKYKAAYPKSVNQSRTISTFMAQDDPQHDNPFLISVTCFLTPWLCEAWCTDCQSTQSRRMYKQLPLDCLILPTSLAGDVAWQVWYEDCLWHHRWLQGLRDGWPMGYLAEHWHHRRCQMVFGSAV